MKQVNLGVIGCGVIGSVHIRAAAASKLLKIVAVADKLEERAQENARKYNIEKTYNDGAALLEDPDVEAVVLALPAGIRTPLALQALRCGKHVLLEKPSAMNVSEIKQLIKARGKLVCACCSARFRLLDSADFVTGFVAGGALGKLRLIRCRATVSAGPPPEKIPPLWRVSKSLNGGGILVNWGVYDLDYLLGITGWSLKPKLVLAQTWSVPPQFQRHVAPGSDAEEHLAALICCQGDAVIMLERGECVAAQPEKAWQIIGTKGSLHLKMESGKGNKIVFDNSSTERGVFSEIIWEGDEDPGSIHTPLVENFAVAVRGQGEPKTGLEQALIIQQITDAIYASAQKEKAIKISD